MTDHSRPPIEDSEVARTRRKQRVFAMCVEALYEHAPRSRTANILNSLIVGVLLWGVVSPALIAAWWATMLTMVAGRYVAARPFRSQRARQPMPVWARRFTRGAVASGLVWGVGAVVLFPSHDAPSQVLLAFVVGGMCAGASSSLASHLPAFYGFLVPAMLPLTFRFAVVGDKFHVGMALMLGLFAALIGAIGRQNHRALTDAFGLRFANEGLVERLREAGASLEKRVEERTQSLEEQSRARAEAEQKLQRAQRLDAVGRLTGGVAHDFNNLLTVIVNSLELLQAGAPPDETRPLVRQALEAAFRGGELTRSLLAFSRSQVLSPQLVDVGEAVLRLDAAMLRRVLPESIALQVEVPDAPRMVKVDVAQLDAAVLNLVLNSRDAILPGSGAIRVVVDDVELEGDNPDLDPGGYVRIRVRDDGAGIEPGDLDRIFEPFFTTKGDEGTGLGLSMVYGFARQSQGTVKIESNPGSGTVAVVLLPRQQEVRATTKTRPRESDARGRGELLLLVEDEEAVRRLTAHTLGALGYRTVEVGDATQALEVLADKPDVDLVMTDVVMPGPLDGLELAAEIRRKRPELPIVITSGYSEASGEPTPWPRLAKPYRRAELARELRRALDEAVERVAG